jgi:protein-S-isoprenylcysteine O-methyltransferase Ste14
MIFQADQVHVLCIKCVALLAIISGILSPGPTLNQLVAGLILGAYGVLIMVLAIRENSFYSSVVRIDAKHTVIDTGLYGVVRHPQYLGAIIVFVALSICFPYFGTISSSVVFLLCVIFRIADEEEFLKTNLAGYIEYTRRVKFRLLPWVF